MKSFTDLEQSRKLAEILPLESADMHWQDASKEYENPYGIYDRHFRLVAGNSLKIINNKRDFRKGFIFPAWSLSALLSIMICPNLEEYIEGVWDLIAFTDNTLKTPIEIQDCKDPIDACVEMILKLNELKML